MDPGDAGRRGCMCRNTNCSQIQHRLLCHTRFSLHWPPIPWVLYQQMELHCLCFHTAFLGTQHFPIFGVSLTDFSLSHPFKQTCPSLIYLPFKNLLHQINFSFCTSSSPRRFPLRVNHISLHSARANGLWIIKAGRFSLFYFMTKLSWVKPGITWMSIEQSLYS